VALNLFYNDTKALIDNVPEAIYVAGRTFGPWDKAED